MRPTIHTFAYENITYSIFSPEIINIKLIKTFNCKIEQTLRNMCFTTNLQIASLVPVEVIKSTWIIIY